MLEILLDKVYGRLFAAQVIALAGTGLLTVALGLLAYQVAGADAGAVLGTALAIKMIAYVTIAPVVGALAARLPRRGFLVAMDAVRAAIAVTLPFVDQVWQVYVLIFLLQAASAGFTPTFQATIPDVLPEESRYTRALSLSRIAYDLDNLLSPALAAVLLGFMSFHWLFVGTVAGFVGSAALILSVTLPRPGEQPEPDGGLYAKVTHGVRIYLKTPRLRGLLAINLAVASAGAMVIVNTVVIVRALLNRPDDDVAVALAVYGGGSMIAALALPRLLDRLPDRAVMLSAAAGLAVLLVAAGAIAIGGRGGGIGWPVLLAVWGGLGLCYAAAMTPSGRLLKRSAHSADRPAVFAAQFALSHACWLIAYPLAGWLGQGIGIGATFLVLGGLAAFGAVAAAVAWPAGDPQVIAHDHPDLPADHPHLAEPGHAGAPGGAHRHAVVIDALHPHWPGMRP